MTLEALVAARVRQMRRVRGMTQERLAEAIGVSAKTLSRYERGELLIGLATLERIATALGVRVGILVEDDDGPSPEALLLIDEWGKLPGQKQALILELIAALQAAPQTANDPEEGENSEVVRDLTDETGP